MARYYYEDARWPWRPDGFLRKFLKQRKHRKQRRQRNEKQITRFARDHRPRALDLGMGYGRNALWLARPGHRGAGGRLGPGAGGRFGWNPPTLRRPASVPKSGPAAVSSPALLAAEDFQGRD